MFAHRTIIIPMLALILMSLSTALAPPMQAQSFSCTPVTEILLIIFARFHPLVA